MTNICGLEGNARDQMGKTMTKKTAGNTMRWPRSCVQNSKTQKHKSELENLHPLQRAYVDMGFELFSECLHQVAHRSECVKQTCVSTFELRSRIAF
jgi:hypothetical protein